MFTNYLASDFNVVLEIQKLEIRSEFDPQSFDSYGTVDRTKQVERQLRLSYPLLRVCRENYSSIIE